MKSDPSCKVVVVMPAYNAEFTLRRTFEEIPREMALPVSLPEAMTFEEVGDYRGVDDNLLQLTSTRRQASSVSSKPSLS